MTRQLTLNFILLLVFIGSCYTPRTQFEVLNDERVCDAIADMVVQLQNNEDVLRHLYIPQDSIGIHVNTKLYPGIVSFARYGCAKYLSADMGVDSGKLGSIYELMYEQSTMNVRYVTNCSVSYADRHPNIRVTFWYEVKTNILTLSAVSLPKNHDYHRGYYRSIQIVQGSDDNNSEIVEGKWVE